MVTNIPIYPVNYYTPAVHRLLQLAANIYDASTNKGLSSTGSFAPGTQTILIIHRCSGPTLE